MPAGFKYDAKCNALTSTQRSEKITVGSEIRFRVLGMSVKTNKIVFFGRNQEKLIMIVCDWMYKRQCGLEAIRIDFNKETCLFFCPVIFIELD